MKCVRAQSYSFPRSSRLAEGLVKRGMETRPPARRLFIPSLERGSSGTDHFVMAITTAEPRFWHTLLRQMTRW